MKPSGTLTVSPNPIRASSRSALVVANLSWNSQGAALVEVRVGAPDGPLLGRTTGSGSATTGRWVRDGMNFFLQDVSERRPLCREHTLAVATISFVTNESPGDPGAIVLLYHRVAEQAVDPWSLCVKPQHFVEHLQVLAQSYRPLSLEQLLRIIEERGVLKECVVVTFDDGYADNLQTAKPLLETYGIPATIFVATGYLGDERGFWWDELQELILEQGAEHIGLYLSMYQLLLPLPHHDRRRILADWWKWKGQTKSPSSSARPMSVEDLASIGGCSLIDIGAHTHTHPVLHMLNETEQCNDIRQSKVLLEEILNRTVEHFAYPHGSGGASTPDIVQRAGFGCACSTSTGTVTVSTDRYHLPRMAVGDWDGAEFSRRLQQVVMEEKAVSV